MNKASACVLRILGEIQTFHDSFFPQRDNYVWLRFCWSKVRLARQTAVDIRCTHIVLNVLNVSCLRALCGTSGSLTGPGIRNHHNVLYIALRRRTQSSSFSTDFFLNMMSHDLKSHSHTSLQMKCVMAVKHPQTWIVEYNSEDCISPRWNDKRIPKCRREAGQRRSKLFVVGSIA